MATDPWAKDPVVTPEPPRDNHSEVKVNPVTGKVGITLKAGIAQDSPWIVLEERSVADLLPILGVDTSGKSGAELLKDLMDTVAKSSAYFQEVFSEARGGTPAQNSPPPSNNNGGGNNSNRQQGEPAGATQGRGQSPGNCGHGQPYKWVTGVNKNSGKAYQGWYCQDGEFGNPNRCKPIYVD